MRDDRSQSDDLSQAFELAREIIELDHTSPVREYSEPDELASRLDLELRHEGDDMANVLGDLRRLIDATPRISSRRFMNQLFGGRDAAAVTAEIAAVLMNTPMHTFKAAGVQVLVEDEVLAHMASKVGYPDGDGMFTSGGSLSNLVAMVLARNATLEGAHEEGLSGERLTVYTSAESHYSVSKALGIAGLGRRNLRQIPADSGGRMDVVALARAIEDDRRAGCRPVMINATAGTTILGAFDPLRDLAAVASEHGIWLHVDAAYGGSVLLSRTHRALLDGCELTDSFTWDAHKAMGVPLTCSVLLVRRAGLLASHFSEPAEYLLQNQAAHNPAERSIQCARRNDALKLWAAWRFHGDRGYEQRIDRLFALADYARQRIEEDPDLRLLRQPESFNVCFEVPGASSREICERLERESRLVVSHVPLAGRQVIRLVCVNPEIDETELATILDEIKATARHCSGRDRVLAET